MMPRMDKGDDKDDDGQAMHHGFRADLVDIEFERPGKMQLFDGGDGYEHHQEGADRSDHQVQECRTIETRAYPADETEDQSGDEMGKKSL